MGTENEKTGTDEQSPKKKASPDLKALKCSACGGDITKTHRVEGSGEDEEYIPIARCLNCGKEYDQHSQEYYEYYADMFRRDLDKSVFKLGIKGTIDGVEYEIIGHIRYQDEDEWEVETWDEWLAISSEGTYRYFVEEEGEIYSFEEYTPNSIDLATDPSSIEFEGKKVSRERTRYTARIVFAEGELPWQPEIGEPITVYDFKHQGFYITIEQDEDEVSITRGTVVPHGVIIDAFRGAEFKDAYEKTRRKRSAYAWRARIYGIGIVAAIIYIIYAAVSGDSLPDISKTRRVLVENEVKVEQGKQVYASQILFGPAVFQRSNSLYTVRVAVDSAVQPLRLEWQSFRLLLIKEDRIRQFESRQAGADGIRTALAEIDEFEEPVESYAFNGDFWDEEGYDDEGKWHESDTSGETDFILDDPGSYYLYVELFSEKPRKSGAIAISILENVKGFRYFFIPIVLFSVLLLVNHYRGKNYNELPFEMANH
ncbi:MAG TPA: DUF4178 domain-containing protein [Spirochaetota bacterium]|nr:DUF4178 domain-containing protein [Spirochaetota bacterium]